MRTISVIGMPMDFGQTHRGVDMGPSALRVAGLNEQLAKLDLRVRDEGDVSCDIMTTQDVAEPRLRFLPAVVEGCARLAAAVEEVAARGEMPLVLGGDHSVSIGTLAGLARAGAREGSSTSGGARGGSATREAARLGLIWIDAHGDLNTPETTPSGNIHGMALAVNLGRGDARLTEIGGAGPKALEENTVLIGVRDLDAGEKALLAASKITVFTMRHIDEVGMRAVMEQALAIATRGVERVHLSLDVDVIDPFEAPGVGTPVPGGVTFREAHLALEILADSGAITSMEVVEVNPTLDDRNRTSELAVGLIASALGQRIL
jgi:arginase